MRNRNWLYGISALTLALALPGVAAAQDSAAATGANPATNPQDIVVTGIRRSLASAQAEKRDSDQILDSVVAEDIGKLPDVTAAESLARITGVQVTRNAGIAQGVTVRGLGALETTYNGREVFTGNGRSVALQDFPSTLVSRIDVYKSASAELLEPGLAGLIDVRSYRPFDFKGTKIIGSVMGLHWYQAQRLGIQANGLASTRWHTGIGEMGFLIEGSYTDQDFQDSSRNVSQTILTRSNVPGYVGTALRYPSFVNMNYANGTRWRPNGAAAFQWRPSSTLEIYLDGLYQGYRAQNEARNFLVNSGQLANLSNVVLIPGTNQIASMDATAGGAPSGVQQVNPQSTDTYQAGGGFIWHKGRTRITGDAAFTDSTFTNEGYGFNYAVTKQPNRHFDFDLGGKTGGGNVTLSNFNLFDPTLYRWTNLNESGNRTHGRSVQARLDVDYRLEALGIDRLQAGIRYSTRDADAYNFNRTDAAPAGQFFSVLPLDYESARPGFRGDDATTLRRWLTPTRDSLAANLDTLRGLAGKPDGRPDWGDPVFTGNEKTYSGYVQARYAFDMGVPVDGLIGVRGTRTDDTIDGGDRISHKSTTSFLPNVSARIHLTHNLQLRLAFTKTLTRPDFGQLNPSITVGAYPVICTVDPTNPDSGPNNPDCIRPASSGNPDLKPTKSTNYDSSLEYYFSRDGSVTLGVFRKNLNGFINNFTTDVDDPEYGRVRLTQPENGGAGRITGVEAAARTFFRAPWLPRWLGDFGALATYTYLDHKSELAPDLAATLPGMQPIAGVSKHTVNLSAFYDKRFVTARLSYNYRSSYVVSYGRVVDPALGAGVLSPTLPIVQKGRGTLDFAATLSPTEHFTLTFNATNLLGAADRNARQFNSDGQVYPWQTTFLESVYRVGVSFRY
ncbi:MAG: TonB-dependent receptor [Sphingomonas sp.]